MKEGDTDIQDLLRGDAALLDAAKKGCLARVQKLCSPENINCRDTQGRNSTPLHLAGKQVVRIPLSHNYVTYSENCFGNSAISLKDNQMNKTGNERD